MNSVLGEEKETTIHLDSDYYAYFIYGWLNEWMNDEKYM